MKLDQFYYHEAIDRLYLMQCLVSEALDTHPVIKKHKELRKLVAESEDSLIRAYQLASNISCKKYG